MKNLNKPEEAARHAAMLFFHAVTCIHAIISIVRVSWAPLSPSVASSCHVLDYTSTLPSLTFGTRLLIFGFFADFSCFRSFFCLDALS